MHADVFAGGFDDPVFQSQDVFRRVMNAMARPGTIETMSVAGAPPAPLAASAGAVALTLFDADTPVWLDARLGRAPAVADWLRFHTGAHTVPDRERAHFALIADPSAMAGFDGFSPGTQPYPDRSATLIAQVETLTGGLPLILTGPGIKDTRTIAPRGLPAEFAALWSANRALFPRGVDMILAGADGVAALPRTTRIEAGES